MAMDVTLTCLCPLRQIGHGVLGTNIPFWRFNYFSSRASPLPYCGESWVTLKGTVSRDLGIF
jgi:hypothetical protein